MQTEPLAFAPIAVYRSRGVVKTIPSCASTQRHASEPWQATLFLLRSEVDGFLPFRSISPTDQIGVVTNEWLQASAQVKYPLERRGVAPPGWLQRAQLGEERAFLLSGALR